MFEENWAYRIVVILSLCILLAWTYLTNEETLLNYISGRFILDTRLIWQVGIFALLSIVLFYLMQSTLDYKNQNEALKKYTQRMQQEADSEREALKKLKSESGQEVMRLESFIITISDMAKQISSVLETGQLLRLFLRKAVDLLGSSKCAIFKVDYKKGKLVYIDSVGYERKKLEGLNLGPDEESGQIGLAVKAQTLVSQRAVSQDPATKYILDDDKIEASYCQPIVHNARTYAVICVGGVSRDLTHQQTVRLLSTLANFGAVALTNTELVDKMREQSRRDSLTWLYNHQYFQERMDILLNQAIREKEALGLIILDLDHFKQFNDTYGHQAGDLILQRSAKILNSELRSSDVIARYGGEELAAILPGRDEKSTGDIAERIRKSFEASSLEFEGRNLKVTISAGVSAFNPSKEEKIKKDLLIKQSDEALYRAKREGRNRVVMHKG